MPERRRPPPKESKPRSRSRALIHEPIGEKEKVLEPLSLKEQNDLLLNAFAECSPKSKQKRDRYEEERARIQFLNNSKQPPYFILQAMLRQLLAEISDPVFTQPHEQSLSERQQMRLHASRERQEGLTHFLLKIHPLLIQEADLYDKAIRTVLQEGGEVTLVEPFLNKKNISIQEQEEAMDSFLRQRATLFDRNLFLQEVVAVERLASRPIDWKTPILRSRVAATYSTLLQCATHQPDAFRHVKFLIDQTGINPAEWEPPFLGLESSLQSYIDSLIAGGDLKRIREVYAFQGKVLSIEEEEALFSEALEEFVSLKALTRRVESFEEGKELFVKRRKEFFEYGGKSLSTEKQREILSNQISLLIPYIKAEDEPILINRFAFFLDQIIHEFNVPVEELRLMFEKQLIDCLTHQRYSLPLHYAERISAIEKIEELTGIFEARDLPREQIEARVLRALEKCSDSYAPSKLGPYLKAVCPFLELTPETKSYIHEKVRKGIEGLARMDGNRCFPEQIDALTEAGLVGINIKTPKLEWIRLSVASQ
ncbi:hypothetical protein KBA73_02810, partial [Patescibacteria group bacterium]|nr:hypothetical protein [Patescibacteria group bacterium]